MSWYRTGTVAITIGQKIVTGTGTAFGPNCRVGDAFIGPDGRQYEVTNITSPTVLTIEPAYLGPTVAAGAYSLMPIQGWPKVAADRMNQIVDQWGVALSSLGAVSTENVVPVAKGGTGGTTPAAARNGLGLVPVTSNIDATAGRLLTPGAGGILGSAVLITTSLDSAALGVNYYFVGTEAECVAAGLPALGGASSLPRHWNIVTFGTATRTTQEATEVFGQGTTRARAFRRVRHDTAWYVWNESPALSEFAQNANGYYVKNPDGSQLGWGTVGIPAIAVATAMSGGGFRSTQQSIPLSSTFIGAATIFECHIPNLPEGARAFPAGASDGMTGTYVLQTSSVALNNPATTLFWTAIGRWK